MDSEKLEEYRKLWEDDCPQVEPGGWEVRASSWIEQLGEGGRGKKGTNRRVEIAVEALNAREALKGQKIADIGCGPGIFVCTFAETAALAHGYDISPSFVDYGKALAGKRGLGNTDFFVCDFNSFDAAGCEGAYDVTFACMTPSVAGKGGIDKMLAMTSKYAVNMHLVESIDTLAEGMCEKAFGREYRPRWGGEGFSALYNLLWYMGYFPEVAYGIDESRGELHSVDLDLAEGLVRFSGIREEGAEKEALAYLESLPKPIARYQRRRYGILTVDVRHKREPQAAAGARGQ